RVSLAYYIYIAHEKWNFKGRALRYESGSCGPLGSALLVAFRRSTRLRTGHLLGHVQNQLAIAFFSLAQQTPKLAEIACIFASTTPGDVVGRLPLWKIRQ